MGKTAKYWDAECRECGNIHVIHTGLQHRAGETVNYTDAKPGRGGCGSVTEHELLAQLKGLRIDDR